MCEFLFFVILFFCYMKIQRFDMKNIPLILDVVTPLWSPPIGSDKFKRFSVEYIVRNNIFENEYRFQLEDGDFLSSAFFARKGDVNLADAWFEENFTSFTDDLKIASDMSRTYLKLMDKKTFSLMNDDDIKLSLFVSRKSGFGKILLDSICKQLYKEGYKNLYLWTDCECNWQWYVKHDFTLVNEDVYDPFSNEKEEYKTYIFKKKIEDYRQVFNCVLEFS